MLDRIQFGTVQPLDSDEVPPGEFTKGQNTAIHGIIVQLAGDKFAQQHLTTAAIAFPAGGFGADQPFLVTQEFQHGQAGGKST
jgi:hypothetical protein